jgi:hypothetical protein
MNAIHVVSGRSCWAALMVMAGTLALPVGLTTANAKESRTISSSGQFHIFTTEPLLGAQAGMFAESVKRDWLSMLEMRDGPGRDLIVVVLRKRDDATSAVPGWRMDVIPSEPHLRFQVTGTISPSLSDDEFRAYVVRALCAELVNRSAVVRHGEPYVPAPLPAWLTEGMAAASGSRQDALVRAARRSVAAGKPQPASVILRSMESPAEAAERLLFQANSRLMVESLLSLPKGAGKLREYHLALGELRDVMGAFWKVYRSDFADDVAVEKWWAIQLLQRVKSEVAQRFTSEQTMERLNEILTVQLRVPAGDGNEFVKAEYAIAELWPYYEQPWLQELAQDRFNQLQSLHSQAHPFYLVVIRRYCEAMLCLRAQRVTRYRSLMVDAAALKRRADRHTLEVAVYMDQMEQKYNPTDPERVFQPLFKTLEEFQQMQQLRRNPINDYLDRFDQ